MRMALPWLGVLLGPAAFAAQIVTDDGTGLELDDSGRVTHVRVGDRVLPALNEPGGFWSLDYARTEAAAPELVTNGDFSQGIQGWQFGNRWQIAEDPDPYRKGKSAFIDFPGPEPGRSGDVSQVVPVVPGTA